jgi:hypothetical protein
MHLELELIGPLFKNSKMISILKFQKIFKNYVHTGIETIFDSQGA